MLGGGGGGGAFTWTSGMGCRKGEWEVRVEGGELCPPHPQDGGVGEWVGGTQYGKEYRLQCDCHGSWAVASKRS